MATTLSETELLSCLYLWEIGRVYYFRLIVWIIIFTPILLGVVRVVCRHDTSRRFNC